MRHLQPVLSVEAPRCVTLLGRQCGDDGMPVVRWNGISHWQRRLTTRRTPAAMKRRPALRWAFLLDIREVNPCPPLLGTARHGINLFRLRGADPSRVFGRQEVPGD